MIQDKVYPDCLQVSSPRKLWYNALLDPYVQNKKMSSKMKAAVNSGEYLLDGFGGQLTEPDDFHWFNLVSSLCEDGMHRPALDYDIETPNIRLLTDYFSSLGSVRLYIVPSSNNYHIYVPDVVLSWGEYQIVLNDMVELGVIEEAYQKHSIDRGQTLLRPPHIRKD